MQSTITIMMDFSMFRVLLHFMKTQLDKTKLVLFGQIWKVLE